MVDFAIAMSTARSRLLSFRPDGGMFEAVTRFEKLAETLNVETCICSDIIVDSKVLQMLATRLGEPKAGHPREVVLVCGAYLEEQISVAAQYLLIAGYPVLLVRDLVLSRIAQYEQVHDRRLIQSGVVATTSQQLIYEWASAESDRKTRTLLLECLQHYAPR